MFGWMSLSLWNNIHREKKQMKIDHLHFNADINFPGTRMNMQHGPVGWFSYKFIQVKYDREFEWFYFVFVFFVSKKNEIKWGNEPTIVEMIWIFMTNKFMHFAAARSSSTERCRSVVDQHSTNINLMAAVVLPFSLPPQFIAFYFIFHKFPIFTVIGIGISVGNHFFFNVSTQVEIVLKNRRGSR